MGFPKLTTYYLQLLLSVYIAVETIPSNWCEVFTKQLFESTTLLYALIMVHRAIVKFYIVEHRKIIVDKQVSPKSFMDVQ